jgi:general secretion pathway protein K
MKAPGAQHGVALVTALLIVSLASVAAVSLATQQQLDVRRTGNLIDGDQAWQYAIGAEQWAKLILRRDQEKTDFDALNEPWAQNLPPIDLPGGYMLGKIRDAHGRFNLNNLVNDNEPDEEARRQVQRLLLLLGVNVDLTPAIIDWIDQDINPQVPDGAEDDYYAGLERPYRTPNQAMASVSELRLIKGFNEKIYQRIAPYVTVLPEHTDINVNTASAEVLTTLSDRIDLKTAVELVKLRQENPFKDTIAFDSALQTLLGQAPTIGNGITTASQFFEVNIETRIGYGRAEVSTLLSRADEAEIAVIRRAQGIE